MEFYASCAQGLEDALANELRALGASQVRKLKGRVSFAGEPIDAERVCLWSRCASRVFAVLARFTCTDADDLYDGTYDVPWEDILRRGSTIAVTARGVNDRLRNTHFSALRVKDALCDRLADEAGARAAVDTEHPDARIALSLRGERASLHLDLSGEPLFRRLPREATRPGAAPVLRPDYAAAVLDAIGWPQRCVDVRATADVGTDTPVPTLACINCAGGGVVLEAALQAADRAPGLLREHWGFSCWTAHDETAWNKLLDEADRRAEAGAATSARIVATDLDAQAVALARRVLKAAGITKDVIFVQPEANKILPKLGLGTPADGDRTATGALVVDTTAVPLSGMARTATLVEDLMASSALQGAPVAALSRGTMLDRVLGCAPARTMELRPNNEETRLALYRPGTQGASAPDGSAAAEPGAGTEPGNDSAAQAVRLDQPTPRATVDVGDGAPVPVLIPESDQFAARLRKVARLRRKWAKRTGITCYRVYDADLPDYVAAIDLYEGAPDTPGRWLVVAEYAAPRSVDPALAQARLLDMLAIAPRVLHVDPACVSARSRTRSRGGSQYAAAGSAHGGSQARPAQARSAAIPLAQRPRIQEGGLTFAVNFDDYLDTGIFLDHRITRNLVRERARGKRFLNLFAYTGTATCYAADGGARSTTTVDLSNTYLDWARYNLQLNGFGGRAHRIVRADVLAWVAEQCRTNNRWDLIFCDPPTFSNSAKMGERTWDVQRDHADLLKRLVHLLEPGGEVIFSCNLRTFKPDVEGLARSGVALTDITEQTIPEDFARNKRIHRCYIATRI